MELVAGMSEKLGLGAIGEYARRVEALGYDTLHVPETVHDGLAAALIAAHTTSRLRIRTSVTLAFIRSPMLTALAAWDLQRESGGRFELGLGTQIRQNVEDRYGMPWSDPVGRMREYVAVVNAAFDAFATGTLEPFVGEHYRLTRLQPFFRPECHEHGAPALWLGGVNAGIVELAGEVASGLITHPTNSHPVYLDAICRPALARGAARAHRPAPRVIAGGGVITAPDDRALTVERDRHRRSLAFLYSTPPYRRTLELLGITGITDALRELARSGDWERLPALVPDDILDRLVIAAPWETLPRRVAELRGVADGILLRPPDEPGDDPRFAAVLAAVRAATST